MGIDESDAERRQLENRSYRNVQREQLRATEARSRIVAGHDRAARLHDRLADLGWGDVKAHRECADTHRVDAESERAVADPDRAEWACEGNRPVDDHE